jgi:hypothetical protein
MGWRGPNQLGYARNKEKMNRLARETSAKARAGTPREAAEGANALLLAVHWSRIDVWRPPPPLAPLTRQNLRPRWLTMANKMANT